MDRHPDFGKLKVTKVARADSLPRKLYDKQWTITNYSRLKPNNVYAMRTIIVQNQASQFTLFKEQSTGQSNINLILSLLHIPNFTDAFFRIAGKNGMIGPYRTRRRIAIGSELHSTERQAHFVETPDLTPDDALTIHVRIRLDSKDCELSIFESLIEKPNLGNLLESCMFADLEIIVGEQTFPAHTAILCARSTVLEAMLNNNLREKIEKRIRIDDADANSVWEMLKYIYTGELEQLNSDLALKLFVLAYKYDLQELTYITAYFLKRNMSMGSAMKALVLADSHNHLELKYDAEKYIGRNLALAMQHEDWASFRKHKDLVDDVLKYIEMFCIPRDEINSFLPE